MQFWSTHLVIWKSKPSLPFSYKMESLLQGHVFKSQNNVGARMWTTYGPIITCHCHDVSIGVPLPLTAVFVPPSYMELKGSYQFWILSHHLFRKWSLAVASPESSYLLDWVYPARTVCSNWIHFHFPRLALPSVNERNRAPHLREWRYSRKKHAVSRNLSPPCP